MCFLFNENRAEIEKENEQMNTEENQIVFNKCLLKFSVLSIVDLAGGVLER